MSKSIVMRNSADNSDLVAADLTFADCVAEGVDFDGAQLSRITFLRCDLYWAAFTMARLIDVTFKDCDLRGADFAKTEFQNCRFLNCDLGTDALGGETHFDGANLSAVVFGNCRGVDNTLRNRGFPP